MPIEFKKNRALFRDEVSVEEAEGLLEWLQKRPAAKVDLVRLQPPAHRQPAGADDGQGRHIRVGRRMPNCAHGLNRH